MLRIELPRGGKGVVREGGGEEDEEMQELEDRIKRAGLPEHALKAAQKELKVRMVMNGHTCMYMHIIGSIVGFL